MFGAEIGFGVFEYSKQYIKTFETRMEKKINEKKSITATNEVDPSTKIYILVYILCQEH